MPFSTVALNYLDKPKKPKKQEINSPMGNYVSICKSKHGDHHGI